MRNDCTIAGVSIYRGLSRRSSERCCLFPDKNRSMKRDNWLRPVIY